MEVPGMTMSVTGLPEAPEGHEVDSVYRGDEAEIRLGSFRVGRYAPEALWESTRLRVRRAMK
jgi:hypothetical protein